MSVHVERLVVMLGLIPRSPRKITVKSLTEHLLERGFTVNNSRMIERNLQDLRDSPSFPLDNDGHKPAGWSWNRDAQLFDIPGMDRHTALTFLLVEQFMEKMLPRSTRGFLQPHFNKAREVMRAGGQRLSSWPRKIAILPKGQPLVTPQVRNEVIDVVYEALLKEQRFVATYKKRGASKNKTYRVDPLALVFRNDQIYLVCLLDSRADPSQLVLHRMHAAELLDEPRQMPANFELQNYMRQGGFRYGEGDLQQIDLVLRVAHSVRDQLNEIKLSLQQQMSEEIDGWSVLRARVSDDWQLWWWLLSFGAQIEVLQPSALRGKMINEINKMKNIYPD